MGGCVATVDQPAAAEEVDGTPTVKQARGHQGSAKRKGRKVPMANSSLQTPSADSSLQTPKETKFIDPQRQLIFAETPVALGIDYLRRLPNPDNLLQEFYRCWARAGSGGTTTSLNSAEKLFEHFLCNADSREDVVRMLVKGLSMHAIQGGIHAFDSFDSSLHDALGGFWKDPSTGEETKHIHQQSAVKTLQENWAAFMSYFRKQKVAEVYILRAVVLLLETPCELDLPGGLTVHCKVNGSDAGKTIRLTFDGEVYHEAQAEQKADSQSRGEDAQRTAPNPSSSAGPGPGQTGVHSEHDSPEQLTLLKDVAHLPHPAVLPDEDDLVDSDTRKYFQSLRDLGLNEDALRKLAKPDLQLPPSRSLSCVLSCIQVGKKKTYLAEGADLVLVVGNTGTGKSTTINYLSGCRIVANRLRGASTARRVMDVEQISEGGPKDAVVKIGHGYRSMTFFPEIVAPVQSQGDKWLTLCDTPGFFDTRGAEISIANAVNTKQTFARARCVRVLALVNSHTLLGDRPGVSQMSATIEGMFDSTATALQHADSIQLAVTHAAPGDDAEYLRSLLREDTVPELLKECGKKLVILDPCEAHGDGIKRQELLKKISLMPGIQDPGRVFRTTALTPADEKAIGEFTKPSVSGIMEAVGRAEYSTAKEKFTALEDLNCLGHHKVVTILQDAREKMKDAIVQLGSWVSRAKVAIYENQDSSEHASLKELLERLGKACVLDACFENQTPAQEQFQREREAVEKFERKLVGEKDRGLENGLATALLKLENEVHEVLSTTTGDLFDDLDVETSVDECRLMRRFGSSLPEPASSRLASLAALKSAFAAVAAEMQDRPSRYCLHFDVERLKQMQSEAKEGLAGCLKRAILATARTKVVAQWEGELGDLQQDFQEVAKVHHERILGEAQGSFATKEPGELFDMADTWFRGTHPELGAKLREMHGRGQEILAPKHLEHLLGQLAEKLELLRKQAGEYQEQLQQEEKARELQQLRSLIENKGNLEQNLARNANEIKGAIRRMKELDAPPDMIQERLGLLQQKVAAHASEERVTQLFENADFTGLADLLRDCETLKASFSEWVQVPVEGISKKFRDLFNGVRQKAAEEMKSIQTEESSMLQRFTDMLRAISQVQSLHGKWVKPHEDTWAAENHNIVRAGCEAFTDASRHKKYDLAARCLVKYKRICSVLQQEGCSKSFKEHMRVLVHPDGDPRGHAAFHLGRELKELAEGKEHPDVQETAKEIIATYKAFSSVNVEFFNKRAGGVTFDSALNQLRDLEGNAMLKQEGKTRLQECYTWTKVAYDEPIGELLKERNAEAKKRIMDSIAKKCRALAKLVGEFQTDFSTSGTCKHASDLIGNIFAMWTITSSGEDYIQGDKSVIVQPQAPQYLVVLHMLGIGLGGRIQNHIAQVGTGEGKSVCLGVLSVFFCLLGFNVNVVCYSSFLSKRDKDQFRPLFQSLSVGPVYGDVGDLCNQILREKCDVRELVWAMLKKGQSKTGASPSSTTATSEQGLWASMTTAWDWSSLTAALGVGQHPQRGGKSNFNFDKSVLLVDEVDVLFGEEFYGKLYNPCLVLAEPQAVALVEWVWKNRGESLTAEKVLQQREAENVREAFRGFRPVGGVDLLKMEVERMVQNVKEFPVNGATSHEYVAGQDMHGRWRVGYMDTLQGVVSYVSFYGYLTAFAYAHAVETGKITDQSEKANMMGIRLCCGTLPYANVPNFFGLKLGLTGSIQSASTYELDTLRTRYNFTHFSLMPSIFAKQALVEEEAEVFPGSARDKDFFEAILKDIKLKRLEDRASLVVFASPEEQENFYQYLLETDRFKGSERVARLTGKESHTQKEDCIAQAARSRNITLITRAFGRGSDFVCRDNVVVEKGGLHVLQTFPCEHKSEEVQIRGRTCRQGDPGSYKQILFLADLGPFGIEKEGGMEQFVEWKGADPAKTWGLFIDKKREDVLLKAKFQQLNAAVEQTEAQYSLTKEFIEIAASGDWQGAVTVLAKLNA